MRLFYCRRLSLVGRLRLVLNLLRCFRSSHQERNRSYGQQSRCEYLFHFVFSFIGGGPLIFEANSSRLGCVVICLFCLCLFLLASLAAHNSNLPVSALPHYRLKRHILIPCFRDSPKRLLMKESSSCARRIPSREPICKGCYYSGSAFRQCCCYRLW